MNATIDQLYKIYQDHPSICTDTRKLQAGDLFFALHGERFDGNRFAVKALENGAAYAVVDDPQLADQPGMLLVEDTLRSLQDLARHHRRQLEIPIIALTG